VKFACVFACLCALTAGPAHSAEIETSTGVVCNTVSQVERFVALNHGDPQAAVRAVNAEANDPAACTVASLAFMRGEEAVTVRKDATAFQIVRIRVVGIVTANGIRAIAPAHCFALFRIEERTARAAKPDRASRRVA
jgi:hypothetical protein